MKKLDVKKNRETVTTMKEYWGILNDFNLVYYYINDSYLYIYSRVTKKESLHMFASEEEKNIIKERINNIKKEMKMTKVNIRNLFNPEFYEYKFQWVLLDEFLKTIV